MCKNIKKTLFFVITVTENKGLNIPPFRKKKDNKKALYLYLIKPIINFVNIVLNATLYNPALYLDINYISSLMFSLFKIEIKKCVFHKNFIQFIKLL